MKSLMSQYKYRCFYSECEAEFITDTPPDIKFTNRWGEWEGTRCPYCNHKAKLYGYKTGLSVHHPFTESLPDQRREHRKSLLQPFRSGEVSKEYLDAYPEAKKGMIKQGVLTQEQVDKAKNVWGNDDLR